MVTDLLTEREWVWSTFFHKMASILAFEFNTWFGIAASFSGSIGRNWAQGNWARHFRNAVRRGSTAFAIVIEVETKELLILQGVGQKESAVENCLNGGTHIATRAP